MGDTFEHFLVLDPAVPDDRRAARARRAASGESRTKPGRRFIGQTDEGIVRVQALPDDRYQLLPTTLEGGTRISNARDAEREIQRRLEKRKAPADLIEQALAHFRAGGRVQIEENIFESREGEIPVGLPLDEPSTPVETLLGIAYMLLALGIEDAIYEDVFDGVRATLRADAPGARHPSWALETGRVIDVAPEPAHMLGFPSVDPPVVRIQLFRTLFWSVHLPAASRQADGVFFWMNLDEQSEFAVLFDGDQLVLPT